MKVAGKYRWQVAESGQEVQRYLAAIAGVLFAGLVGCATVLVPEMPTAGTDPSAVVAYIEANQRALEWTWFLSGEAAWIPGLVFCGGLAVFLGRRSAGRPFAIIGLAFSVLAAGLTMSMSVPWGILVYLGPQLEPGAVLVLAETRHFADATTSFALAGMLVSFGAASSRIPRRWPALATTGLIAAIVELTHGVVDFAAYGQTGILLPMSRAAFLVWVLVAAGLLGSPAAVGALLDRDRRLETLAVTANHVEVR